MLLPKNSVPFEGLYHSNLLNVGHSFRCLALLLICLLMTLNMLIHNTATDYSNGKLWNINAEKLAKNIFEIHRSNKVNHLPLESKNENNPIPVFYFERATPKSRETCNLCSLPVSEYLFHFLVGVVANKPCDLRCHCSL